MVNELFDPNAVVFQGKNGKEYPALSVEGRHFFTVRPFIQMRGPGMFWKLGKPERLYLSGLGPSRERTIVLQDLYDGVGYDGEQSIYVCYGNLSGFFRYQVGVNKYGDAIVRWKKGKETQWHLEDVTFEYDNDAFSPVTKIGYELSARIRNRWMSGRSHDVGTTT